MGKRTKKSQSLNIDKKKSIENSSENSGDRPLKIVQPYRHRRQISKIVLSKGQRNRLLKKQKWKNRQNFLDKITKPNKSENVNNIKTPGPKNFNLENINNEIKEITNQEIKIQKNKISSKMRNKKQNLPYILNKEKNKILKTIENPCYLSDPLETIKRQIHQEQILKERQFKNKKLYEEYNSKITNYKS